MDDVQELDEINKEVHSLEIGLKRCQYEKSSELAMKTLTVIDKYVQSNLWKTAEDLLSWLGKLSENLSMASVSESAPSNIILRVKKLVKDDYISQRRRELESQVSVESISGDPQGFHVEYPNFKSEIQNSVWELISELETSPENIAEDADKHIHANEVVLTLGKSRTVEVFLKRAAKAHTFDVIIAECAPFCHGQDLASNLSKCKIRTTLISDSMIFSMMSRVNKVIIGTHSILANGGLKSIAGSHMVTLAAKHYNVPVIVLSPMYKLSPEYPLSDDVKIHNRFMTPELLVNYSDSFLVSNVEVYNPIFDYVPPELVSLFIFNIGSHAPSYIYRLLHETYGQITSFK